MTWNSFASVGTSSGTQSDFTKGRVIIGKYGDGEDCVLMWPNDGHWIDTGNRTRSWVPMPKVLEIVKELKIDLARASSLQCKTLEEVLKRHRWHETTLEVKNIGDPKAMARLEKLIKTNSISDWGLF